MRLIDADALKEQIENFNCKDCNHYNFVRCGACQIDDALSYIDEAPTIGGWISVKDRLPNEKQSKITHDFEYVLCATTFGEVRAYKFGTPIGWSEPHFWHGAGKMDEYVTHWMPLPELPEVKQDG